PSTPTQSRFTTRLASLISRERPGPPPKMLNVASLPFRQTRSAAPPAAEYASAPMPPTGLTGPGFAFAPLTKSDFEIDRVCTVRITFLGAEYVQLSYRPRRCSFPGATPAPRTAAASARVTSLHGSGAVSPRANAGAATATATVHTAGTT